MLNTNWTVPIPRVKWVHFAAILAVDGVIKAPVVSDTEIEKRDTTRASLKNNFEMDIKHGHDMRIRMWICVAQCNSWWVLIVTQMNKWDSCCSSFPNFLPGTLHSHHPLSYRNVFYGRMWNQISPSDWKEDQRQLRHFLLLLLGGSLGNWAHLWHHGMNAPGRLHINIHYDYFHVNGCYILHAALYTYSLIYTSIKPLDINRSNLSATRGVVFQ